jgi:hypothetical protein
MRWASGKIITNKLGELWWAESCNTYPPPGGHIGAPRILYTFWKIFFLCNYNLAKSQQPAHVTQQQQTLTLSSLTPTPSLPAAALWGRLRCRYSIERWVVHETT